MTETHFILVPGYWLGGWAWDRVAAPLRDAGHQVTAVTLPGLESLTADRTGITLSDHVDALADVVQAAGRDAVLVVHSGAGKLASGVLDTDPLCVRRVIYVDSGPSADGAGDDLPVELSELPLPSWAEMTTAGTSLDGLSPDDLARFRELAVPQPAAIARERIRLRNPARRQVPSTIVSCSFPSETVATLARAGDPMFAEVARLVDLSYLDLPTGHWPMWSRPTDLADELGRAVR